jgi:AcrR family transcriptional regulator
MSSPENNQNQARLRETKAERSARTRKALLKATLASLAENGYAGTSTTDVVKRAGLSRGALAHHFPSKAQLVAEAAAYLINKRIESTSRLLSSIEPDKMSIESWIRIQWEAYEKWFPANIEFMIAARTDNELRKHFSKAIAYCCQYGKSHRDASDIRPGVVVLSKPGSHELRKGLFHSRSLPGANR